MRYLIVPAAIAATLVSTPAMAHNDRWYIGGDVGVLLPRNTEVDITDVTTGSTFDNAVDIQHHTGWEIDGNVGYDFGGFKLEGEVGYKHSNFDAVDPSAAWVSFLQARVPGVIVVDQDINLDEGIDIIDVMANGMVDFGSDTGFGGYVGVGAGMGFAKAYGSSDEGFAWQLIGGVRYPVSESIDVGLKYKYFDLSNVDFRTGTTVRGTNFNIDLDGKYRAHSILLNFTYNM